MIAGRVLYVSDRQVWRASGAALYMSHDCGVSWQCAARADAALPQRWIMQNRLSGRLLRAGIHHFLPAAGGVAVVNRSLCSYDAARGALVPRAAIRGSRPLAVATDGEIVCYGEYRANSERSPVHVWGTGVGTSEWRPLWKFAHVRHVHGVYFDAYARGFWVTTGDEDEEAGLWFSADRFRTLERVAGGTQQLRAVTLLFASEYVYFGSDSPHEANYLYRLERRTGRIEKLQPVGSSVFHGCKVGTALFFSTAVEPSRVNLTRQAEIWGSRDGERWQRLVELEKDGWPMRYFQYGQIYLPAGPGDDCNLWCTPFAVRGDQTTRRYALTDLALS